MHVMQPLFFLPQAFKPRTYNSYIPTLQATPHLPPSTPTAPLRSHTLAPNPSMCFYSNAAIPDSSKECSDNGFDESARPHRSSRCPQERDTLSRDCSLILTLGRFVVHD